MLRSWNHFSIMEGMGCQWIKSNMLNTWFVLVFVNNHSILFMDIQKLKEILDVKTLNENELIEYHLKTLAKWTVNDCKVICTSYIVANSDLGNW